MAVAWARDLHTARRLERDATTERVAHQDRWQPLANQFDERERHRLRMPEVGRGGHHLGRDHNVLLSLVTV